MTDLRIERILRGVQARVRAFRFSLMLTTLALLIAVVGTLFLWMTPESRGGLDGASWLLIFAMLVALVISIVYSYLSTRDTRRIAESVEANYPDLDARLLTSLQLEPEPTTGQYPYLERRVLRETLRHDLIHPWRQSIPTSRLLLAHVTCLASIFGVLTLASLLGRWDVIERETLLSLVTERPSMAPGDVQIEPGNVEVERGSSVLVTARFAESVPAEVQLWARYEDGREETIEMRKSLDDPLFGARLASLDGPAVYGVRYAGQQSDEYRIDVFEYPRLDQADVQLVFPSYTGLAPRQIADVRRVTAVEGTEMTVICHVNKPLVKARLVPKEGEPIELQAEEADSPQYKTVVRLEKSASYRVELTDADGRQNPEPRPQLVVTVTENRPPELKFAAPGRDTRVSPLEELRLAGTVQDDFGILRYGLSYQVAGKEEQEIGLSADGNAVEQQFEHVLDFEALEAQPDQLVAYHLWAEDAGPDGEPRRTFSDMYFAEVRHFEEIFRQGQMSAGSDQPPGGGGAGGGQQQMEQLGELQKQIINGTWTLMRRERASAPSEAYQSDVTVLLESQQSAIQQLDALAQQLQDPQSLAFVDEGRTAMQRAVEALEKAAAPQVDRLPEALTAEQAAYQALLQLRAREHEVVRGNPQSSASGSGGGGSSLSQQQLQQLELRDDENRYETERTAQPTEDPAQREVRQALSRLRELARRQEDLNEQVKQLESALQQARTEEERRELERQLKRLREEQQEILRDTEELEQRMQQPENQQRMRQQQEQLSRTRENVRQASEALEEGQLSQAINSGTRAQRELEQMQEELRRQASSQFEQEMREMRDRARQLANNQQELVEQLDRLEEQETRSLRDSSEREKAVESLEQQSRELQQLLDAMQEVVQQAEESEPLLSSRLYDAYRQTLQDRPDEALREAAEWVERGISEEAVRPAQAAQQGLDRLAEAVERAAEGVLGDETEALRRAREELERLADQLAEEIERSNPQADERDEADETDESSGERAEGRSGRASDARDPNDEPTSGSGEPADNDAAAREGQGEPSPSSERDPMRAEQGEGGRSGRAPNSQSPPNTSGGEQSEPTESEPRGGEPMEGEPMEDGQPASGQEGNAQAGEAQEGEPSNTGQGRRSSSENPMNTQAGGSENQAGGRPGDAESGQANGDSDPARRRGAPGGGVSGGGGVDRLGGLAELLERAEGQFAPLTGDDFLEWSDRLRDVEEMLDDSELRAEAARIRDRARDIRMEYKRHSKEPNWELVQDQIARPLVQLRDRVAEQLRQREGSDELAPIDRDPVPPQYAEQVQRYYEKLGSGRE